MSRKYITIEYIENYISINKSKFSFNRIPILIKNQTYVSNDVKLNFICSNCNNKFEIAWKHLKYFHSCPYCIGKKFKNGYNDIKTMRPDLVKYFLDETDSKKYTISSKKELFFKCPNCNFKKKMRISNLSYGGFNCNKCSTKVSKANKFLVSIFSQLSYEFRPEKQFKGSAYKYDLYVNTKTKKYTIEAHGEQHYKKNNFFKTTLREQKENDKQKRAFSESLGNIHIEINCRRTEFKYLKEQFIKSLSPYFDLSNIKWENIYENIYEFSIIKELSLYYEKYKISPTEIGKIFKMNRALVRKYLKIGFKLNLCSYTTNMQYKYKCKSKKAKKVYQFDLNGNLLNTFDSVKQAKEITKISHIDGCCRGDRKRAGRYIWRYKLESK